MPSRLLREGILDSEAVNSLSPEAEVFYRRLMSVVDDYGRFDARASVLRARLYPLKVATVTEEQVINWLLECDKADLVAVYRVEEKPYLQLHRLGAPRAKQSKYPPPPQHTCQSNGVHPKTDENVQNTQMKTDVNECVQVKTSVPYSGSGSDSTSYSDSSPTSGSGGRTVGYDPLKESEKNRKEFVAAWNAAGLRKLDRLTHTLHGRLDALLLSNHWAATWREALVRAGKIPFLASGVGRRKGPLDPGEFLANDDFADSLLRGVHDPHEAKPPPVTPGRSKSQLEGDRILAEAYRKRGMKPPPELEGS